ncbi:MAG TPA: translation factor Sua5 [Phaeodactylibacter sp.]|nr:translation factor Sua5 [Phaeodactylibacter sp.]
MRQNYPLERGLRALKKGGVILYPTDTIWSLGCDALDEAAIARLREIRQLSEEEPLTVLVSDMRMLLSYIGEIHPRLETLLIYHRRPLTILYEGVRNLPETLLSSDGQLPIRVTVSPFCKELIGHYGRPLIASAACQAGGQIPSTFGEIRSDIIQAADYVFTPELEEGDGMPSVLARLSEKAELIFLRS